MVMNSMKRALLILMGFSLAIGMPQRTEASSKYAGLGIASIVFAAYVGAMRLRYLHNLEEKQKADAKAAKENNGLSVAVKPGDYNTIPYKARKFFAENEPFFEAAAWPVKKAFVEYTAPVIALLGFAYALYQTDKISAETGKTFVSASATYYFSKIASLVQEAAKDKKD